MKNHIYSVLKNSSLILNEHEYKKASVIIAIIEIDGKPSIIFEKRAQNIHQAGEISFVGGMFDSSQDNSSQETAIREACEELNITKNNIKIIGDFGKFITRMDFIIDVFVAEIVDINFENIKFNKDEVENLIAIPIDYFLENNPEIYFVDSSFEIFDEKFKKLDIPQKYKEKWVGRKSKIFVYNYNKTVIWGVTSEILFNFINSLKKEEENEKN